VLLLPAAAVTATAHSEKMSPFYICDNVVRYRQPTTLHFICSYCTL